MKKIPTLFLRDPEDMRKVTREVHPNCQWVLDGEGTATRKYDGTCVMLDDGSPGRWWARREVKPGKTPPRTFRPEQRDEVTGKTVGWEPISQSPFFKMFLEALEPLVAFESIIGRAMPVGTYELVGPKINGNPERCRFHRLERHETAEQFDDVPLVFDGLLEYVTEIGAGEGIEGIVWHHPDGRMAKLKCRDALATMEVETA